MAFLQTAASDDAVRKALGGNPSYAASATPSRPTPSLTRIPRGGPPTPALHLPDTANGKAEPTSLQQRPPPLLQLHPSPAGGQETPESAHLARSLEPYMAEQAAKLPPSPPSSPDESPVAAKPMVPLSPPRQPPRASVTHQYNPVFEKVRTALF